MKNNILFACSQNVVRSMMAEFLFYKIFPNSVNKISSCGIRKGITDGYAISVMKEIGLDTRNHVVKTFKDFNPKSFDIVVSFSELASKEASNWSKGSCRNLYFPVKAPKIFEQSRDETLFSYRIIRDEIATILEKQFKSNN